MRIKFITFGCSNNRAESEMMAGLLKKARHNIVEKEEDLAIINVCSVKGPSLNKGLRELKKAKTKVIVTGCIPPDGITIIREINPKASIVDTHNLKKIVDVVDCTSNNEIIELVGKTGEVKSCIPRFRLNPIIGILPISSGCTSSCVYCITKLIKGDLVSYPIEDLVKEFTSFVKDGCKEMWITAQDTGNYGEDINSSLPELLSKLLEVEGNFKIRLGMINPNFVLKYLDELTKLFNHPKMFRFIHIPVQSGSNKILKLMGRKYGIKDYIEVVQTLKENVPKITIATDIIAGFPTESENDFKESIKLIKETRPDIINFSRFWPHPKTPASKMKQVSTNKAKKRSKELKELFEKISLENNKKWIGWKGDVLIDEKGKDRSSLGRNFAYKPIVIKGNYNIGKIVKKEIKKVSVFNLRDN